MFVLQAPQNNKKRPSRELPRDGFPLIRRESKIYKNPLPTGAVIPVGFWAWERGEMLISTTVQQKGVEKIK